MADEPFVDTHAHFWDHSVDGLDWAWLKPGFTFRRWEGSADLDAPQYLPPELRAEADGAGLGGVVHVHAADMTSDPVVETAWLQSVGDEHGWPDAIVGLCTLQWPDAPDVLRRHAEHARFRGIRDPNALEWLDVDLDAVAPAMDVVAELGASVELRRPDNDVDAFIELASRWPSVTIFLSHGCFPLTRTDADRASWAAAMQRLAPHENVVCKISTLAGASDPEWTVDSIRPWILTAVDVFGPDRCVLGSNFPVDRLFGTYVGVVDAYRQSLSSLSPHEQAAVLHGTAERLYGIDVTGS